MTYPIIYTRALPGNAVARSKGPVIWMLDSMRGNEAVLQHELTHVKQWAALSLLGVVWAAGCYRFGFMQYAHFGILSLALHQALYTILPLYRQWAEVQAYRVQVKYGGDITSCATSLSRDYGLTVSHDKALTLLKGAP